jgi:hypothetical protein
MKLVQRMRKAVKAKVGYFEESQINVDLFNALLVTT